MDDVSGSPEVASIMFEKISAASLFVGDLSLVASGDADKKRRNPNPNVSIEMGFAAATLGWDRVICVMNESLGERFELPFDFRNRRFPITYTTKEGITDHARAGLTSDLKSALLAAESSDLRKVDRAIRRLDLASIRVMHKFSLVDYFAEPIFFEPKELEFRDLVPKAIPRLLDLDLIYADVDPEQNLYAYHWTHLGKKVLGRVVVPKPTENVSTESIATTAANHSSSISAFSKS